MIEDVQKAAAAEEAKPKASVPAFSANEKRPSIPAMTEVEDRVWHIVVENKGDLQKLFGGTSDDLGSVLARQCFAATGNKIANLDTEGATTLLVAEIAPKDALAGC